MKSPHAQYLGRCSRSWTVTGAKVLLYGLTRMIYMGECTQEYCGIIAYESLSPWGFHAIRISWESARWGTSRDPLLLTAIEGFPTVSAAAEYLENGRQEAKEPENNKG